MLKITSILILAALSQVNARNFGRVLGVNSAEDPFGIDKACQPLVVRPQTVPKPPAPTITVPAPPVQVPLTSLPPVAGPCYCRRPVVKPAVIPKPACRSVLRRRISSSNSCAYNNENNHEVYETVLGPLDGPVGGCAGNGYGDGFDPLGVGLYPAGAPSLIPGNLGYGLYSPNINGPYGASLSDTREQLKPADPVSVSIAYSLAQKAQNLKEDALSFGFRQIPKDVPAHRKGSRNIPEENLYSLNGAVVELKPVTTIAKSVDEEAAEQL
ncbi:hypothetical protein WA026_002548 [Henosepilachna vigintioctopunctata]|uniref:Uncharacterized protein n=1 Tax=Henosepilachna vigintioctopunctata TaxID=420089 RepID=A0AAW1TRP5_9CUCU